MLFPTYHILYRKVFVNTSAKTVWLKSSASYTLQRYFFHLYKAHIYTCVCVCVYMYDIVQVKTLILTDSISRYPRTTRIMVSQRGFLFLHSLSPCFHCTFILTHRRVRIIMCRGIYFVHSAELNIIHNIMSCFYRCAHTST